MPILKYSVAKMRKILDAIENEDKIYCLTITPDIIIIDIFESEKIKSIGDIVIIKNGITPEDEITYYISSIFFTEQECRLHCQSLVNNLKVDY
jgi:hypothetical protein